LLDTLPLNQKTLLRIVFMQKKLGILKKIENSYKSIPQTIDWVQDKEYIYRSRFLHKRTIRNNI